MVTVIRKGQYRKYRQYKVDKNRKNMINTENREQNIVVNEMAMYIKYFMYF